MRLLVTGGGTGGHVNAGIAVLDELLRADRNASILYVGTKRGLESILVPRVGYPIKYVLARGIKRENIFKMFFSLCILIPISLLQSLLIILSFKPDAVLGVGGYASAPVLIMCILLRKKYFILEQNTIMGFTNRMFSRFASRVFIAFPMVREYAEARDKTIVTGNPVRSKIKYVERKDSSTFNIFVFGGSQGARGVNDGVIAALPELCKVPNIRIVHQTGKLDFKRIAEIYSRYPIKYEVFDYIHDIENIYKDTDLVIARSGASTISELLIGAIPSILIPLPTAADNHQYHNAKYLADINGAVIMEQKDLTDDHLVSQIRFFMDDRNNLKKMRENLKNFSAKMGKPEANILAEIKRH